MRFIGFLFLLDLLSTYYVQLSYMNLSNMRSPSMLRFLLLFKCIVVCLTQLECWLLMFSFLMLWNFMYACYSWHPTCFWPSICGQIFFPLVLIALLLTCAFEFRQADILIDASLFVMIQSFVWVLSKQSLAWFYLLFLMLCLQFNLAYLLYGYIWCNATI
jgi:hypothetical protein